MGQQELMWLYLKLKMIKHKTKEKKRGHIFTFYFNYIPIISVIGISKHEWYGISPNLICKFLMKNYIDSILS